MAKNMSGVRVIEDFRKNLSGSAGVYRMVDQAGKTLYVGKAKNLYQRVLAYTRPEKLPLRLQRMVAETMGMEVVTTHTEAEALLLEANLIKKLAPRYNILLRDDKSFAYIMIATDHDWPQILKHRGTRSHKGEYFGPFASTGAVNKTLSQLQRAFMLRSCSDNVFSSRSRPCLLHQIKRCCAPCVGRVDHLTYASLVEEARSFLAGRSRDIQKQLVERMEKASAALEYEESAIFRDRIRALARIQAHQNINLADMEEADVIALHEAGGFACIQVFFFRAGCNLGNCSFFPIQTQEQSPENILKAFIGQFYEDKNPPTEILLSHQLPASDIKLIGESLAIKSGRRLTILSPLRGERRKLLDHACDNAREALGRRLQESAIQRSLLESLVELFRLDDVPSRIEIYDNSHIQGSSAVGAMVVFGAEGFEKGSYRKFNIRGEGSIPGDDFAMMREVLLRRFRQTFLWPDMVLIDGGAGHLQTAMRVFAENGIENIALVAISKGVDRNAGRETFHMPDRDSFTLPPDDPRLYFLQRLRDEAHRFAIGTHRAKRSKALTSSPLDAIEGIGAQRKRALLLHFGSARGVAEAGLVDLEAVDGISKKMAEKIYGHFHC